MSDFNLTGKMRAVFREMKSTLMAGDLSATTGLQESDLKQRAKQMNHYACVTKRRADWLPTIKKLKDKLSFPRALLFTTVSEAERDRESLRELGLKANVFLPTRKGENPQDGQGGDMLLVTNDVVPFRQSLPRTECVIHLGCPPEDPDAYGLRLMCTSQRKGALPTSVLLLEEAEEPTLRILEKRLGISITVLPAEML